MLEGQTWLLLVSGPPHTTRGEAVAVGLDMGCLCCWYWYWCPWGWCCAHGDIGPHSKVRAVPAGAPCIRDRAQPSIACTDPQPQLRGFRMCPFVCAVGRPEEVLPVLAAQVGATTVHCHLEVSETETRVGAVMLVFFLLACVCVD